MISQAAFRPRFLIMLEMKTLALQGFLSGALKPLALTPVLVLV
jgi:hypothetical protein